MLETVSEVNDIWSMNLSFQDLLNVYAPIGEVVDGQRTTDDEGRRSLALGHLINSGDLKSCPSFLD